MGDPQLAADVAGAHSLVGQLHYSLSHNVGQGPPVDKNSTKLVNSTVT